ncbi:MAG: outer membrane protein [Saprospiraceae bacterium]|jgi:outer membrane protein
MLKRKFILIIGLLIVICSTSFGQKTGFVNVQLVLSKIPEYQLAQEKLNEISKQYMKEITNQKEIISNLYGTYQADKILLSQEMRDKKELEIEAAKTKLESIKIKRFGEGGDLFTERQKLIKPIQDKVYSAIEEIGENKGFSLILDVSSDASILYYNEKYDKTQDVMKKLGYL